MNYKVLLVAVPACLAMWGSMPISNTSQGAEGQDPSELREAIQRSKLHLSRIQMNVDVTAHHKSSGRQESCDSYFVTIFRDGFRRRLEYMYLFSDGTGCIHAGFVSDGVKSCEIKERIDRALFALGKQPDWTGSARGVFASIKTKEFSRDMSNGSQFGNWLDGDVLRGYKSWHEVLSSNEYALRKVKEESVDGHACLVIEAETENGIYMAWVDPTHDWVFRRLSCHLVDKSSRGATEVAGTAKDKSAYYDVLVDDIVLSKVNNAWTPISGKMVLKYPRIQAEDVLMAKRKDIKVNPDFPVNTFDVRFPAGSKVQDIDTLVWYIADADGSLTLATAAADIPCLQQFAEKERKWSIEAAAMVGKEAPEIEAEQFLNSAPVRLKDLRGHCVILEFSSIHCAPCRLEMPQIERDRKDPDLADVRIILVHDAVGSKSGVADVEKYVKENHLTYPIVIDQEPPKEDTLGRTFAKYRVLGTPEAVLIGPEGKVVSRGFWHGVVSEARQLLRERGTEQQGTR